MKNRLFHFPSPGLAVAVALVAAVTARPSFAGIGDDVDSAFQRSEQYGNIEITNKHSAGIQKEAEKGFRNAKKRSKEVEGWKGRIKSDGNGNFYVDKAPASGREKTKTFSVAGSVFT